MKEMKGISAGMSLGKEKGEITAEMMRRPGERSVWEGNKRWLKE